MEVRENLHREKSTSVIITRENQQKSDMEGQEGIKFTRRDSEIFTFALGRRKFEIFGAFQSIQIADYKQEEENFTSFAIT